MTSSSTFQYRESSVAEQLGLSTADLKRSRDRHLVADSDWKKMAGEICFSAAGLSKLWRLEQVPRPRTLDLSLCIRGSKKGLVARNGSQPILAGSAALPIPRKFTITLIPPNPRTVLADDEHGLRQLVDVGNNATFVVGDEIEVAPHRSQLGIWRLLSSLPRDKRRPPKNLAPIHDSPPQKK
jgi:hypothetical protein